MFRKNLFVLVMGLIAVTLCSPLLAQQKTEKKIFRRITPKGQVKSVKIGGRDWGVRKINSVHDLLSVKQLNKRNFGGLGAPNFPLFNNHIELLLAQCCLTHEH